MRGKYHMMDWELQKWSQELSHLIECLTYNQDGEFDLTNWDACPANICKALEHLGWKEEDLDDNGWQHDTWYRFTNPNYAFGLTFYYEGYTFEMKLYRTDQYD